MSARSEAEKVDIRLNEINLALEKEVINSKNREHEREKANIDDAKAGELSKLEIIQKKELDEHLDESRQLEMALLEAQKAALEEKEI